MKSGKNSPQADCRASLVRVNDFSPRIGANETRILLENSGFFAPHSRAGSPARNIRRGTKQIEHFA
jgi:hypothetical protein